MRRTGVWKWFPTPGRAVTASPLSPAHRDSRQSIMENPPGGPRFPPGRGVQDLAWRPAIPLGPFPRTRDSGSACRVGLLETSTPRLAGRPRGRIAHERAAAVSDRTPHSGIGSSARPVLYPRPRSRPVPRGVETPSHCEGRLTSTVPPEHPVTGGTRAPQRAAVPQRDGDDDLADQAPPVTTVARGAPDQPSPRSPHRGGGSTLERVPSRVRARGRKWVGVRDVPAALAASAGC